MISSSPDASVPVSSDAQLGVSTEGSTQDQGATKFFDDTVGVEAHALVKSSVDLFPAVKVSGAESLEAFLERPTRITNGNLTVTDSGMLWSTDPFLDLVLGVKSSKLSGLYLLKAGLKVTLQVNAARFQTGRYILGFVPSMGTNTSSPQFQAKFRMHTAHLQQMTQHLHVEIDIATQTHVTLNIPWMSVLPAWPLQSNLNIKPGFGYLYLMPYYPLQAGAADTIASYSVWASFTNPTFGGPTVSQSGMSAGEREQRAAGIGPIGSTFSRVSSAAAILSGIPALSPYATAVGWTSGIVARAANAMGWSKPLDLEKPMYVLNRPLHYTAVHDQVSTAVPIGFSASNRVVSAPTESIPTHDEMSFDFVNGVYSYLMSINWEPTHVADSVLFNIPVTPVSSTSYGKGVVIPACSFGAQFMGYWRGGVKFRFKLVKNEFYSGRLSIHFEPFGAGGGSNATAANWELNNRLIVDIREASEFEVVVPFISHKLYVPTTENIGALVVSVVDRLIAPDSVPSILPILIEIAGASDLEYMFPTNSRSEVYIPAVSQSGYGAFPSADLGTARSAGLRPAEVAVGEKVQSLRQIGKVLSFTSFANEPTWGARVLYSPFASMPVVQSTSNVTALTRGTVYGDQLNLIECCYAGLTGSKRVQVTRQSNGAAGALKFGAWVGVSSQTDPISVAAATDQNSLIRQVFDWTQEPYLDVNVPPYLTTAGMSQAATIVSAVVPAMPLGQQIGSSPVVVAATGLNTSAWTTLVFIARQGGDDWNCYHWISTPPIVARTTI